jgi:NAD+ synthase (glutamine-hydrolysing)
MAQINPTVGDLQGNVEKMLDYMEQARELGADLVAFPELAVPGYPPEDLLFKPDFIKANTEAMRTVVEASKGLAVVVGYADADGDIYNAAAVGHDGRLIDVYHKIYLPTYAVFDEDRYFKKGGTCPVYVINGVKVGVNICEDIWYDVGPTTVQRKAGAEVIITINGSPYHAYKGDFRERMVSTRAADNGLYVAYLNMVGGQDELVFDGRSLVYDQNGELVARGKQFEEQLLVVDLDADAVLRARLREPRVRKEAAVLENIGQPKLVHISENGHPDMWGRAKLSYSTTQPMVHEEEIYNALVLGTRDYVRKNGFKKVVVGLSGGIDSSITVSVAVDALGKENVLAVSMPSRYSSEGSAVDAKILAENLGIELWTIPIEPAHSAYLEMFAPYSRGMKASVAEENIQARIRGNTLMWISNKFGWLVLTTGDKSEMAVGYATLYGDMSGGFAVIKDVPKTQVYQLARWRNSVAKGPLIPESVLNKPPSPELKPDQKAEDTLPPYAVLDPIMKAYVEEDRSYQDIVDMGYEPDVVKKVITMIDRTEYKRRQAAPGVRITPRAFGKDRRLPITNRYRQF